MTEKELIKALGFEPKEKHFGDILQEIHWLRY